MAVSDKLYVISDESNRLKIGVTCDVVSRLKTLQTGNPEKLTVLYDEEIKNPTKIERYLHRHFHEYRLNGEWFSNVSLDDIRIAMFSGGYFVD
jgi:hypothetical protein